MEFWLIPINFLNYFRRYLDLCGHTGMVSITHKLFGHRWAIGGDAGDEGEAENGQKSAKDEQGMEVCRRIRGTLPS